MCFRQGDQGTELKTLSPGALLEEESCPGERPDLCHMATIAFTGGWRFVFVLFTFSASIGKESVEKRVAGDMEPSCSNCPEV